MQINSLQNKNIKFFSSLKLKKNRDQAKKFLIEGDHLIDEAIKHDVELELISTSNPDAQYFVTEDIMKKISTQKSICENAAVCSFLIEREIKGNILILDNLQDPGNLGTIIRSASAFNIDTIILSNDSVDLYNEKVIRASEGMMFHMNILRRDLTEAITKLKNDGYTIIGTDVKNGSNIKSINNETIAIVIGNEGSGISDNIKSMCDKFIKIKMNKDVESLNAAVAASIIMYEVYDE